MTQTDRNAQKLAWANANERCFRLKLNRNNPRDAKIVEFLETQDNVSDYIRRLIQKDMENAESK